ncbi:bifunctional 4-hydroxy-2-oxoglutarate aldolase/2-dehydro-3-deoxy-phosphogluconate aldolase [Myceligenerans pegani]|uniref:2-dehydro-3-deoxy-phosphogluconate aldolase n=1 Tax=Myceligenerans pegani TaxID=2776917 RepID=A0ABR9N2Q1_9MICO|nr:bifunctional 4-hydroxy-2-oxoglutarate aldolase/2-dehydro-3-deoxy-phosphogluconate aldolase [Myceligenerans sp. TRM 65318]MBE1877388.1 bifunctional 4-hydroxy-2-oxoglutarate aldolase/2-dehydro-3-deoxy-phosphogluconate aldolase [Myceligenerans sp. TRM 65318]MBE3019659.1 bifunctional 4-hydroxy-2-oxoglutarate aldolase/2-dehydro-3-deoxy-phosphogluconate aldolase [Myceligenerans sp. TRM 65318]
MSAKSSAPAETRGSDPTRSVLERLGRARVVPVVVVDDAEQGLGVARALDDGGLPVAEVTFRTSGARAAIEAITAEHPGMLVGAGTVVNPRQVDQAVAAGATFLVSPGLSAPVVRAAQEAGVPILPGVATASDIMAALDLGITTVKLFPAGVVGGPGAIKALSGPFGQVTFVPTGGVSAANLPDYLGLPSVLAVGGSWMVDQKLVAAGDWAEMTRRTAEAVAVATDLPEGA